jgi:hypothetical protein
MQPYRKDTIGQEREPLPLRDREQGATLSKQERVNGPLFAP